jgi:OmpR family response regulator RpaB
MSKILLIDDDQALAPPLREYFGRFGLDLISATHPQQGLELLASEQPALVILDVMLPDMDGFEVCRIIRKNNSVPIIMLTARGEVMDRVVGLELGADDYLPKPFEPRELVARINNILKRSRQFQDDGHRLKFENLEIDLELQGITVNGTDPQLTSMEYRLLVLLAQRPGKPFSRDEILNELKGVEVELYTRSVDILVSRLRQKLKPTDYIKTVRGSGYSFVAPKG